MPDNQTFMSVALTPTDTPLSPAEEVAMSLHSRIVTLGIENMDKVTKEYEVIQMVLGGVSWWQEARRLCDEVVAEARREALEKQQAREEREREHELEMARIRSQQNFYVVQQLPNATAGMNAQGDLKVDQANVMTGAQASVAHTKNS